MSSEIAGRILSRAVDPANRVSTDVIVDEELAEARATFVAVESALRYVPQDALGRSEQGGWFYRDELAAKVEELLRQLEPTKGTKL